ncbi:MAG: iron ABC transporter permease [Proteobacteria bacterium]|nr:iron ABC transporter permease [Pseudomonadota bacterium]
MDSAQRGRGLQIMLPATGVLVGLLLIVGPFLATAIRSLLEWGPDGVALSAANFAGLFADPRFYRAAFNTIIAGAATTACSLVLGFSLAWVVARTDLAGRSWLETLNLVPFFLSPYVGAISWIYLMAPNSGLIQWAARVWFGVSLDFINIFSLGGVVWVLTLFYTPYVYLFVIAPLRQMDAAFEDAARVHGASFWTTLRQITLPLVAPAMLSAGLIVFVTSAGLFDVPLALASPRGIRMMPTEIFSLVQYPSDLGRAAAFGMTVLVVTILLTLLQHRHIRRRRFDTVTGKGYRPRQIRLKLRGKLAAWALEILYVGCGVVLPMIALVMVSLSRLWTGRFNPENASIANFDYVLTRYDLTQQAITNSLILAFVGATLGVALSLLQAYYLTRGPTRRRALVDALLALPLGIPGIILGLGFLILAVRTPLYSTLTIILIAYIARFFPFATRTISAMFLALNPELEQSARASGASWLQTMRLIVLPLLRPAIVAAWLMLFVIFVRELGATILLYAQGTETISVALVILSERSSGYVAALAVIQLVLLVIAFTIFRLTRTSIVQN